MTPEQILATIRNHNIKLGSLEECAKCELHLCVDYRVNDTDEECKCFFCGKPVFAATKFPEGGPQPKKIGLECALEHAKGEQSFDA